MAVIIFEGNVLVGKVRQDKIEAFGGLKYVFPGGSVEESESEKDTVIREAKEETGLDVDIVQEIGRRVHPVTGKEIVYFHCEPKSIDVDPNAGPNDDLDSTEFVTPERASQLMPTMHAAVRDYILAVID